MDAVLAQSHRLRLPVRAQVLHLAGKLAFQQSDLARARALDEESLSLARELGDPSTTANALSGMGIIARKRGDLAEAQALYEESLTLFRELGDSASIASSHFALGMVALRRGDADQAWSLGQESLAYNRETGNPLGMAHPLGLLGEVAALRGDYEQAAALLRESLTLARDVGGILQIALGLVRLAGGDTAQEYPVPMARLFAAAESLLDSLDVRMTSAQRAEWDRNVAALCGHLDAAAYETAWEEGRALPLEQAIAEALTVGRDVVNP
jgi:tetratricopeptide (TPR) repeat protein